MLTKTEVCRQVGRRHDFSKRKKVSQAKYNMLNAYNHKHCIKVHDSMTKKLIRKPVSSSCSQLQNQGLSEF